MKYLKDLSPDQQRQVDEILARNREALRDRPEVSDEELMAETEVSDEEYARGFGVIVSGTRRE